MKNKLYELAEWLHILECSLPHETDLMQLVSRGEEKCYYNLEEQIANTWESPEPDHEKWLARAEEIVLGFNVSSHEQAMVKLSQLITVMRQANEVIEGNPYTREFFKELL